MTDRFTRQDPYSSSGDCVEDRVAFLYIIITAFLILYKALFNFCHIIFIILQNVSKGSLLFLSKHKNKTFLLKSDSWTLLYKIHD